MEPERAAGAHHVGDRVGHPELHRNLHRAIETDDRRVNPTRRQVFSHQVGECGGDPLSRKVLDTPLTPLRCGIAERRRPETQRQALADGRVGFLRKIATGDAEVQLSRSDVDRDVFGPEEEEFDVVGGVDDGEILGIGSPPVPGLGQDLGGRFGQRALVGHGDP